ncbi:MAG: hypothetical protein JRL30_01110 [Deltaproteobacteria bacterium]|nr:hypothetical protein [Deltaproteobacteria bacterium]
MNPESTLTLVERFGLPAVLIVVLGAGFWWMLRRTLKRSDDQIDEAKLLINNHLTHLADTQGETARVLKGVVNVQSQMVGSLGRIEGKVGGN